MSRFLSDYFSSLEPYVPGEQPAFRKYIKLNTNENPYPPSPAVQKVINFAEVSRLNLYSDPSADELVSAAAEYFGTGKENIFVGNGSDEVLAFAFYAFAKNKTAAFPDITYGFYTVFCGFFGIDYKILPLDGNFRINTEDYLQLPREYVIIIANPNAQVGCFLPVSDIERLLLSNPDRVVIVDEAYIDFAGNSDTVSCVPLTEKYSNLLVVQTVSKSRSLAGARVGIAVGSAELISDLNTMKFSFNPYNLNRLSIRAAAASFRDASYMKSNAAKIVASREKFKEIIKPLGFESTDSAANFLLVKHNKINGYDLYRMLKDNYSILVRYLGNERIKDYVRITVGTDEQMQILFSALEEITKGQNE